VLRQFGTSLQATGRQHAVGGRSGQWLLDDPKVDEPLGQGSHDGRSVAWEVEQLYRPVLRGVNTRDPDQVKPGSTR